MSLNVVVSEAEIRRNCIEWAKNHLTEGFVFRPYQLETIVRIISNRMGNVKTQVMEAPTGSGKSITAFVVAGVLLEYYNITSYILASDVALFKQYRDDLKRYNLDWGCVSGKDNYSCASDGGSFSSARCQNYRISFPRLLGIKQDASLRPFIPNKDGTYNILPYMDINLVPYSMKKCVGKCQYLKDMRNALEKPIVVTTYQLWYMHQIFLKEDPATATNYTLQEKGMVIGDEAHNLPSITQGIFSPTFNSTTISSIQKVLSHINNPSVDISEFEELQRQMEFNYNPRLDVPLLRQYQHLLEEVLKLKIVYPKENKKHNGDISNAAYTLKQLHCCIQIYLSLIAQHSISNLVKAVHNSEIIYHFADEPKLVRHYFADHCSHSLLMSATIGNLDAYQELIGLADAKDTEFVGFEVPSTFDFTKSPIYYTDKNKMSYTEKQNSLPNVVQQIVDICNMNPDKRGIIQTGSYEFSKALFNSVPNELKGRLVSYNTSKEKHTAINEFMSLPNKILIGPSIFEGLNFNDELCRFIIIMKVPYASIKDPLVKAKMKLYPRWYSYETINRIVQGVGRGIRSANDWAVTYIVDGCFNDLVNKDTSLFSESFLNRLQKI